MFRRNFFHNEFLWTKHRSWRASSYLVLVVPDFDPNGSGIPDFGHSPTKHISGSTEISLETQICRRCAVCDASIAGTMVLCYSAARGPHISRALVSLETPRACVGHVLKSAATERVEGTPGTLLKSCRRDRSLYSSIPCTNTLLIAITHPLG